MKTPAQFNAQAREKSNSAHPRNFVPNDGMHIVDDAFEAWKFTQATRFAFVMYLGKSAKPWRYFGYATEEKRDIGCALLPSKSLQQLRINV